MSPVEVAPIAASDPLDAAPGESPPGAVASLAAATGLLLVVLLAIHLATIFLRDPETVDAGFLIDRWQDWWWLLADWGLLLVGTTHALLAIWHRASEPPASARLGRDARRIAAALLSTVTVALFLAASRAMMLLI